MRTKQIGLKLLVNQEFMSNFEINTKFGYLERGTCTLAVSIYT